MKCTILISAPCAGKGTVSDYIKEKYNMDHISTGNLLRKKAKLNDEFGKKIKEILDKGLFVDDDTLVSVLEEQLVNQKKDFILDGTPRVLNQAKILNNLFEKYEIILDKVIFIDIDKNVAKKRVINRKVCEKCEHVYKNINLDICPKCGKKLIKRSDDNITTYLKRYEQFEKNTLKVLDFYKELLITIDNNSDINTLYSKIDKIFKGDDKNDNN